MKKRGQMKLSFGMIFSIILIIIFIAFAFYAIQKFLGMQKTVQIGQFKNKLQSDIDEMWKGTQGSQEAEYALPKKIKYVCFIDINSEGTGQNKNLYKELKRICHNENLVFYPISFANEFGTFELEHVDIEKITKQENPFCVKNANGKVKITIKKDYEMALVYIER